MSSTYLSVAQIRLDGGTQQRVLMSDKRLEQFQEMWEEAWQNAEQAAGDGDPLDRFESPFEPVVIFYDGGNYWLADGFYRIISCKRSNLPIINAVVLEGQLRDAIAYSVGANARHGLPRTDADIRHAMTVLLEDDEWGKLPIGTMAEMCGISRTKATRIAQEWEADMAQPKSRQEKIKVKRGDKEYEMDVSAIRTKKPKPPKMEHHEEEEDGVALAKAIETMPLAAALALYPHGGAAFKQQAMHYIVLNSHIAAFRNAVTRLIPRNARGPYTDMARDFVMIPPPDQWQGCPTCYGSLRTPQGERCHICQGGFVFREGVSHRVVRQHADTHRRVAEPVALAADGAGDEAAEEVEAAVAVV